MLAFLEKTSFPAELIDEIFELVGDSTSTLLSLGLVCKRTLANTRSRLFSVLEFTNADSFNRFLRLAGAPWTSFTSSVREIHLQDLSHNCYWKYNEKDPRLLAASNLCNVKSLSITVHFSSRPLPDLVLEFIFHLKIRDLQLDGVAMSRDAGQIIFLVDGVPELKEESIALLTRLPPSVETLTFRNLRFDDIPKLSHRLPLFRRPIRFRMLDSISLALFKEAFNPLILSGLNIAVKTFHILSHDSITAAEARTRSVFTRRFLHHVGHSVEQLLVTLNARCRIINISKCASMSNVSKNLNVNFNREYTPVFRPISTFPLHQPSDDIFYIQALDPWSRVILTCIGHVEDAKCLAFAEYSRGMLAQVRTLYVTGAIGLVRISRVSKCPSEISAEVPKA